MEREGLVKVIHDKEEVAEIKQVARQEFINVCRIRYGYNPFNDEHAKRSWP